jgi:polyhydroxybutyrate depolymerase
MFLVPLLSALLLWPALEERVTVDVDGVKREALVVLNTKPAPPEGSPLVFAFHGHGGTARHALRTFALQTHWPEAIVVYPQGIPGVKGITDADGSKTGWQKNPGELNDRDVKFFDVLVKELTSKHQIDRKRIYAMGHSNGSRFVCVLWKMRGDTFAAVSTSGGQGGLMLRDAKHLPVLAIAGEQDRLVKFEGQKLSLDSLARWYGVDRAKSTKDGYWEKMKGQDGTELVTYFHPGGHEWPKDVNAEIVSFFRRQVKK